MQMRGSSISANSSRNYLILAGLSGIVLMIYPYLKKMITSRPRNNIALNNYILNYLGSLGLNSTLSRFALAQFQHETNNFTSIIFTLNNNVCGMKYAKQSLSTGEKNGYAAYSQIEDSMADFVKWYTKHRNNIFSLPLVIIDLKDYVRFLKNCGYFEDTEENYLKGCMYFFNLV